MGQDDPTPAGVVGVDALVRLDEPAGRWVLTTTVLGSGVAMLTGTVVNVALPALSRDLGATTTDAQWVVNGYLLVLASLILVGGSLGDRYGRRRVYLVGVTWFGLASLLCAVAPNIATLTGARMLQGIGGALLTPGSLAIIQASFAKEDRGRAIGAWSGLGGIAGAVGPVLGGWLVDVWSWRAAFLLNLPLAVAAVVIGLRYVPESRDRSVHGDLDVAGALLGAAALAGLTYALIEAPNRGLADPVVLAAIAVAVGGGAAFVAVEHRVEAPTLPPGIFADRDFAAANLLTFIVYGALGGVFFLLVVTLQVVTGLSATMAGAALLPVTALMLVLSPRAGDLAQARGPRLLLTAGPALLAVSMLLMSTIGEDTSYWTGVLPAVVVFGLGLSATVAPVTSTVLAAADAERAGVASGVNNAVSRAAQLVAIALLPVVAGIAGEPLDDPAILQPGFATAMRVTAVVAALGAVFAWFSIRDDVLEPDDDAPDDPERDDDVMADSRRGEHAHRHAHCPWDGPAVQPSEQREPIG